MFDIFKQGGDICYNEFDDFIIVTNTSLDIFKVCLILGQQLLVMGR